MSEGNWDATAAQAAQERSDASKAERERHERVIGDVLDGLRGEGYFRDGEEAKIVFPPEGEDAGWIARVKLHALMEDMDPETRKKFPNRDEITARLQALGYTVEYLMDYESMTDTTMDAEYKLTLP